jgi:hypothetical protein
MGGQDDRIGGQDHRILHSAKMKSQYRRDHTPDWNRAGVNQGYSGTPLSLSDPEIFSSDSSRQMGSRACPNIR